MNCLWCRRDSRCPPAGIRLDAPAVRSQCVGASADAAPELNTQPSESIEDIERRAVAWVEGLDKTEKTGSRHHTVPRFYLARFVDNDRLWVRDRALTGQFCTGRGGPPTPGLEAHLPPTPLGSGTIGEC